jgi:hypothetical protein
MTATVLAPSPVSIHLLVVDAYIEHGVMHAETLCRRVIQWRQGRWGAEFFVSVALAIDGKIECGVEMSAAVSPMPFLNSNPDYHTLVSTNKEMSVEAAWWIDEPKRDRAQVGADITYKSVVQLSYE